MKIQAGPSHGLPAAVERRIREPERGDEFTPSPDPPEWIQRSDRMTQKLLKIQFDDSPESGSAQGVTEYDREISQPGRQQDLRTEVRETALGARLRARLENEKDERVAQDYRILLAAIDKDISGREYGQHHDVPFQSPLDWVTGGLQPLLDGQTPAERRQAVVERLRKYAGLEEGYEPLCDLLRDRLETQMGKPGITFPSKVEVEGALERDPQLLDGIESMLQESGLQGWQEPFAALKEQMGAFDGWVKEALLPHARDSFRLSPEAYRRAFQAQGITDTTPEELASKAHQAFSEIQAEMAEVAKQVADERHLPSSDYRDVLRALKAEQVAPDDVLPLYQSRLKQIEGLIQEHDLVTLPAGEAIIRLATSSEAAQLASPQMIPPPLVNNHGERGQFVLPLVDPSGQKFDDFTYDAVAWPLAAHEARPGHELQFDSMVDKGVSKARAIFADNSANVEGWGLYSEWMMQPYLPAEGRLSCLNERLLRAARAFLDPELHSGKITVEQAREILSKDVSASPALVDSEIERYTTLCPAQACSYFYGYSQLRELRTATEERCGDNFSARKFHDFVLDQGLLPPPMLREAVEKQFG